MSIEKYQEILHRPLAEYVGISSEIGDVVAIQSQVVHKAFQAQLKYISAIYQTKQPKQADIADLLHPVSQHIKTVQEFCNKNRSSPHFNHLSAIGEGVSALAWITVRPSPSHYIKEIRDAGEYYTNRILREWRNVDIKHIDWVNAWSRTLNELQEYVKNNHATGLVLKPKLLFDEINQGEDICRNLRKVDENARPKPSPSLAQDIKTATPTSAPFGERKKAITETAARFIRESNKWNIEHQNGNHGLTVCDAGMDNSIYLYKCADSTLTVKGKVNSIILDSCTKTSVLFDSVISALEFINCRAVRMQVISKVSTIMIMNTDGCQIYLSRDSLDVQIISSKSSEMNVLVPRGAGDYIEHPIPEQYKSTFVHGRGIVTVVMDNN